MYPCAFPTEPKAPLYVFVRLLSWIVKTDSEIGRGKGKKERREHGVELDLINRGKKIDPPQSSFGELYPADFLSSEKTHKSAISSMFNYYQFDVFISQMISIGKLLLVTILCRMKY